MNDDRWQRVSALLDDLFDLAPEARAARLAQMERDDPDLAAELRRLLAADERSGVLDIGVAGIAPTVMSNLARDDVSPARSNAASGQRIGHYRLIERVGSGGMGEVWRAERTDDFEQAVAVKLIRPLLDSPQLRERFARERQILARLDHPNIARLLDGGVSEDGTPWYAMEFVRGDNIALYVQTQALDTRAKVDLLLQVVDAVAHAQAQLVVHRDLKPSNILVDAQGRARVLDFGIARLLDDASDAKLTGTGVRVFSPAYAAPEQIRGHAVGTAADVFALGAVLYELLTGQVPHPQRSASPDRLIAALEHESAPRPSDAFKTSTGARSTRNPARDLAGDLDTIVATALQPDAARRYTGAAQLGDDLRRWLDGRPIAAQPDTAGYRMRKFVARHRIAVGSASAVLLALIGGLGLAVWQANVARQHAARADAEAQRANVEAQRAEHEATQVKAQAARTKKVKEFLVSIFLQADPLRRTATGPVSIAEAFDAALERARTELASDPVLQADVLDDFGEIRANQGQFDEAQALFEQAVAVAEKEYGPEHPILAESLINLGVIQAYRGNALAGAPYAERAIAILEKDDGGDPLAIANALSLKSAVAQQAGDHVAMRAAAVRMRDLVRQRAAPGDDRLLVAITNVAMIDVNDGRIDEAEAGFREAIGLIEAAQGPNSPHLHPNLAALADIAFRRGRLDEEAALYRRALQIARDNFPEDHRWVAMSLIDVGSVEARDGDAAQGEAQMREGIAMYRRMGSPHAVDGLRSLSLFQSQSGDAAGALATLSEAWGLCQSTQRQSEQVCLAARANRAHLLARQGRAAQALSEVEALEQEPNLHMASPVSASAVRSERAQVWRARAAALAALGRKDEALVAQDRAVELLNAEFGAQHPESRTAIAERDALR
jgi:tetratricopeptide (TPR) repeat protein/tRNA A-37 threonylcarbamoyl transferase component Bud32